MVPLVEMSNSNSTTGSEDSRTLVSAGFHLNNFQFFGDELELGLAPCVSMPTYIGGTRRNVASLVWVEQLTFEAMLVEGTPRSCYWD
jgi:hypothetical protein